MSQNQAPNFEKYIKNGEVAVLYHSSYGAGWSSWAKDSYKEFLMFDNFLVNLKLQEIDSNFNTEICLKNFILVKEYLNLHCQEVYYTEKQWENIKIKWIPKGYQFKIKEFDGYEEVKIYGFPEYFVA